MALITGITTMVQTTYFRLGLPRDTQSPHLALYQPVLDRFLLVLDNLAVAREVRMLASGRYALHICDLRSARNYTPNLVDNTVCSQWSLSNPQDISVWRDFLGEITSVDLCQELGPVQNFDTSTEQQWLQILAFFTQVIQRAQRSQMWYTSQEWLSQVFDDRFNCVFDRFQQSVQQIKQELYLSRDNQCSVDKVLEIVSSDPYLSDAHRHEQNSLPR